MQKKSTGWGWIIFWMIVFWPIGLFLVIRKFANDKSALMSGKTGQMSIIGWALAVLGGLMVIGSISDFDTVTVGGIAMVVGGVMLLRQAKSTKATATKYKRYIDIVINHNDRSLDNISYAVGAPYEVVAKDLQDMINIGYLRGAYIDHNKREISFEQRQPVAPVQQAMPGQAPVQTQAVRCPGCGANNVVVTGRVTECEYCGTPINA